MANRLYLTTTAPTYTPATRRGAWDITTAVVTGMLRPVKRGTNTTSAVAEGATTTALKDVFLGRWISQPVVTAGALSGTAQAVIAFLESAATADFFTHIHAFVTVGDSDTVRGTLIADDIGVTEWGTVATAISATITLSSVSVQVGDRVVVEVGYQSQNVDTTSYTGTMRYGGTAATDLAAGTTGVTTNSPWVEFSDPLNVLRWPASGLVDDFNDGTINRVVWPTTSDVGTPSETGGVLSLPAVTTTTTLGSTLQWVLGGSSISWKMTPPSAGTATQALAYLDCYTEADAVSYIRVQVDAVANTFLWKFLADGSTTTWQSTAITYSSATHAYFRVSESGGTLTLSTSADGVTWTTRDTRTTPTGYGGTNFNGFNLNASRDAGATGTSATFDDINVLPPFLPPPPMLITVGAIVRSHYW